MVWLWYGTQAMTSGSQSDTAAGAEAGTNRTPPGPRRGVLRRAALYPNIYAWFVFLSAMDIMLTCIVLYFGGREVNILADWVFQRWGLPGMVVYKFLLVVFVVMICEIVGRLSMRRGRRLAKWAVVVTAVPVVLAFAQLWVTKPSRRPENVIEKQVDEMHARACDYDGFATLENADDFTSPTPWAW